MLNSIAAAIVLVLAVVLYLELLLIPSDTTKVNRILATTLIACMSAGALNLWVVFG